MSKLKITLIIIGAIAVFIAVVTIKVMAELKAESASDFSVENIDDAKFPIADYLYADYKPQEEQINLQLEPTKENIQYLLDNNGTIILDSADNPIPPISKEQQINPISNATKPQDTFNIGSLFDTSTSSQTPKYNNDKYTNEIFKDNDKINAILAKRNTNAIINSSKKAKTNLQKEYGDDSFTNLNIRDLASNEHKLFRTLSAFKNIPATLTTSINSDIGGKVIAKVEEDVFAEMGKAVLIPKGSKVLGFYAANNKIGEYRLRVIWTRILTPNGININLTDAQGADVGGASGLIGELDSKYWQRYGIPLALSTISNALIITISKEATKFSNKSGGDNTGLNAYTTAQLMQNTQGDISSIMKEIIEQQVKIQPTIRIHAGSRIFISSSKDIFFPIPKKNEVLARFFNEIKNVDSNNEESKEIGENGF